MGGSAGLARELLRELAEREDLHTALQTTRQAILRGERERFEQGYTLALEAAGSWALEQLEAIVSDWRGIDDETPAMVNRTFMEADGVDPEDEWQRREWSPPRKSFKLGFWQGLHDLWISLNTGPSAALDNDDEIEFENDLERSLLETPLNALKGNRAIAAPVPPFDDDITDPDDLPFE